LAATITGLEPSLVFSLNFDTEVGDGQWGWLSLASSFKDDHHQEDDQDHFDHDDDDQDVNATTGISIQDPGSLC